VQRRGEWEDFENPTDEFDIELDREERCDTAAEKEVREILGHMHERERNLLGMLASGASYETISKELGVAKRSVGTYRTRAVQRFMKLYRSTHGGDGP